MLSAIRKSDGQTVLAYDEYKRNGPFACSVCGDPVVLRTGSSKISHFAHENPLRCLTTKGESELHRKCKMEIYAALIEQPNVSKAALERPLGTVRPDVSAMINGVPVAIEVQISNLSIDTILYRTIEYHRQGIYVLWLLPWRAELDLKRYTPSLWEKWVHATYFGRVYYWTQGLEILSYRFEPCLKSVPKTLLYSRSGEQVSVGGYTKRSKRFRTPIREDRLNLAEDFVPRERYWWEGNGVKVPDAKLFMHRPHRD